MAAQAPQQVVAGRYRLDQRLGAGGFGEVWKAHDLELDIAVAVKRVKLLDPDATDVDWARAADQARAEARHAAALAHHPHIVAVTNVVTDGGGLPWLVMRYIHGRSLGDALKAREQADPKQGPLHPDEAGPIAAALLSALDAAHRIGIVHRDVKPANVMLADGGGIFLADFGIAKRRDETVTLAFTGSIGYAAPERWEHDLGDPNGTAADLFSLGATLYRAVEGIAPFEQDPPTAQSTLLAVCYKPHHPIRRAGRLSSLIEALLAKNAADRPTIDQALVLLRGGGGPTYTPVPRNPATGLTLAPTLGVAADQINHAVGIAVGIADPGSRAAALVEIAAELAAHAPDRLARIEGHLTPPMRGMALLIAASQLAESDPVHALRLADQAGPVIAAVTDDDLQQVLDAADIGEEAAEIRTFVSILMERLAASCDPARAGQSFDRWAQILRDVDLDDDDNAPRQVMEVAKAAGSASATDLAWAADLMRHVEQAAGELRAGPDAPAWLLSARLAEIARFGRAAAPDIADRLEDLAVQTALALLADKDRDTALQFVAEQVADPDRAQDIIGRISASHARASAWGKAITRAAEADEADARRLLDAAERAMLPAVPAPAPAGAPQSPLVGWELKYVAQAALRIDPRRAERIALQISDAHFRVQALTELVTSIAPDDPGQARVWLQAAYSTATAIKRDDQYHRLLSLGLVVEAAAAWDPRLARSAARDLAAVLDAAPRDHPFNGVRVGLAANVAVADPALAVRLADQIQGGDSVPGYIVKALLAVAAGVASTNPGYAHELVDRAYQEAARSNDRTVFEVYLRSAVQAFAVRDPRGARRFAERLDEERDASLKNVAEALGAKDPVQAEKAARAIADDRQRTETLASLASAIVTSYFENTDLNRA